MVIGGTVVRGRIDAVFNDADGATVVDWKTGDPPDTPEASATPLSSSPSTGWHGRRCAACPSTSVRAAFHYVRSGQIVIPESLPEADELAALLHATRSHELDRSIDIRHSSH